MVKNSLLKFIGRDAEVQQLLSLIRGDARLITIVAMGGSGKTSLAKVLANSISGSEFELFWIEERPDNDPQNVLLQFQAQIRRLHPNSATANDLGGYAERPQPSAQLISHMLGDQPALLVLDGAENYSGISEWLTDLLVECPSLKILATSRQPLGVPGEMLFHLPPLSLVAQPGAGASPAAQLFLDRARLVNPQFAGSGDELAELERLVQLLEGLPLAIEILASFMNVLTCADAINLLQNNFQMLLPENLDGGKSLEVVLQHSWSLLQKEEQDLLTALCIFEGDFTREAALAITKTSLSSLRNLTHRSLLLSVGRNHFRIHALVQMFVKQLPGYKIDEAIQRQFVTHHLKAIEGLSSNPFSVSFDVFNVRHVYKSVELANSLRMYSQLDRSLDDIYTALSGRWNAQASAKLIENVITSAKTSDSASPLFLANLQLLQAKFSSYTGQWNQVLALLESIRIPANLPSEARLRARNDILAAEGYIALGNPSKGISLFESARNNARKAGDSDLEIRALCQFAIARFAFEFSPGTLALMDEAHKLALQLSAVNAESLELLIEISLAKSDMGDALSAISELDSVKMLAAKNGNTRLAHFSQSVKCLVLARMSQFDESIHAQIANRDYFAATGELYYQMLSELYLGYQYMYAGDAASSEAAIKRSDALAGVLNLDRTLIWSKLALAINFFNQGLFRQAKIKLAEVIKKASSLSEIGILASARALLAECHLKTNNLLDAYDEIQLAYAICKKTHLQSAEIWTLTADLHLALRAQKQANAEQLTEQLLKLLTQNNILLNQRPFAAYLYAYKYFISYADPRADQLLNQAISALTEISQGIKSPELRNHFLTSIPEHAMLLEARRKIATQNDPVLTKRQAEILRLIALGRTNQEIALTLNISLDTTRKHVSTLFGRLNVGNRTGAVHKGREMGIIQ